MTASVAKQQKKFEYEFGGPFGAVSTMVNLPLVILFLYFACGKEYLVDGFNVAKLYHNPPTIPPLAEFFDATVLACTILWILFLAALFYILPGETVFGSNIQGTSQRLKYKLNGHSTFWVSIACALCLDLTYIYDHYLQFAVSAVIVSLMLTVYLSVTSFIGKKTLAEGISGNFVYDIYMGRELNPRIGSFDLKVFCELRPGLIGWVVINLGMMAKQRENLGYNTVSMYTVAAGQALYVWDSLYHEQSILTTMDITTDGFGYMLAFGDLAWVPFTYTLQTRFLVDHEGASDLLSLAALVLTFVGFSIFRLANSEKDRFRRAPGSPEVAHLKTMDTGIKGKKLLISGWWGTARKINYTGDWILGLSWSMVTGSATVLTYFYPIYFAILLIHRAGRDDHMCRKKYGDKVWEEYKAHVPYCFIPYVL